MDNYKRQTVSDVLGTKPNDKRVAEDVKKLSESLRELAEQKPGGLNQFPFKKGLYTVTKVFCTQNDCLNRAECHDQEGVCGEMGLQEDDPGCYMICHEYNNQLMPACIESDKKVYWARKYPYGEMRPTIRNLVSKIAMNIDPDVTIQKVRIGGNDDKKD